LFDELSFADFLLVLRWHSGLRKERNFNWEIKGYVAR
jgi:hypothetical protein